MQIMLAIISGLITSFIFPTVFEAVHIPNLGFLGWFSLVPLFYAMRDTNSRRSFCLTFITAIIYYSISLYWIYNVLSTYGHIGPVASVAVMILMMFILASYISLAPMVSVMVERKWKIGRFWTLPIFWVALESLRNMMPCGGFPWGNITNSQYAYLPLIQIVDVVGVYGLTYLMIAVNIAVMSILLRCDLAKIITASMLFIATFAYGLWRMNDVKQSLAGDRYINVALLQGNIPQEEKWRPGLEESQVRPYLKFMHRLKDTRLDLIVWPEASYPWPVTSNETKLNTEFLGLGEYAAKDVDLLLGGLTFEERPWERILNNSVFLVDNLGNIKGRYHKIHLVPLGEYVPYKKLLFFVDKLVAPVGNFVPGKRYNILDAGDFKIGPLICYEDIFPEIGRKATTLGANFLTVVTNDAWFGKSSAPFQHLAISVFRAVENRKWLVRAANTGVSAVVDPVGNIISQTEIFEEGMIITKVGLR